MLIMRCSCLTHLQIKQIASVLLLMPPCYYQNYLESCNYSHSEAWQYPGNRILFPPPWQFVEVLHWGIIIFKTTHTTFQCLWQLTFQTYVDWNRDNLIFTPRSHIYKCEQSVVSPAPTPVNNFKVTSYNLDKEPFITLNMNWTPPLTPNGMLTPYNVCIGSEPLDSEEVVQPNTGHICGNLDEVSCMIIVTAAKS